MTLDIYKKKKKPMVANLFDQLPTDVIYYEIFPYLDYNSRVTANLLLPLKDRLRTPLRKDAVIEISMLFATQKILPLLRTFNKPTTSLAYKTRLILKIWRYLLDFPILLQYSNRFREITYLKAIELKLSLDEKQHNFSKYACKKLNELLNNYLIFLEKTPFIREVGFQNKDGWTATNKVF